jgi:hypothetical protein
VDGEAGVWEDVGVALDVEEHLADEEELLPLGFDPSRVHGDEGYCRWRHKVQHIRRWKQMLGKGVRSWRHQEEEVGEETPLSRIKSGGVGG